MEYFTIFFSLILPRPARRDNPAGAFSQGGYDSNFDIFKKTDGDITFLALTIGPLAQYRLCENCRGMGKVEIVPLNIFLPLHLIPFKVIKLSRAGVKSDAFFAI